MAYSKEQIEDRINKIKKRYKNFDQIIVTKETKSDLYLLALDYDNEDHYLKMDSNGQLFVQFNAQWKAVKNFLYRESNQ